MEACLDVCGCDDLSSLGVKSGVDINLEVKLEQAAKTLQNASVQVVVVLQLEELLRICNWTPLRPALGSTKNFCPA